MKLPSTSKIAELAELYPAARARYFFGPGGFFDSATYWLIHFIDE